MKRIAFGALQVTPDEFWRMTPAETNDMLEGYNWRMERTHELIAWHAANVMQPHLKKRITPKMLLGKGSNPLQKESDFKSLWDKVERKRKENADSQP